MLPSCLAVGSAGCAGELAGTLGRVETGIGLGHERVSVLTAIPFGDSDRAAVTLGSRSDETIDQLLSVTEAAAGENRSELVAPKASQHINRS